MNLSKLSLPTKIPKVKISFTKSLITKLVVIAGLIVFAGAGWFWWQEVYTSPERVFWGAIENSLKSQSVTRQIARNVDSQQPDQFLRLHTSPVQGVVGANKYYQSGDRSVPTMVTETIGTLEGDFIRILELTSSNPNEPTPDLANIRGVWADATPQGFGGKTPQLFSQFSLGIVPLGRLTAAQRAEVIASMHKEKVYDVDFKNVERIRDNNRSAYVYNVQVRTEPYLIILQRFASFMGMDQLENIDPSQYRDSPPLEFRFLIDSMSHQLIGTQRAGGETIRYHSYGLLAPPVQAPRDYLPLEELQQRLQTLQ
jgi:hypothetical protein